VTCEGEDVDEAACSDAPAVQPAYHVGWIPSFRAVTDFADFDSGVWIHLTGASGHAFHKHYDDQLDLWAAGETLPWVFSREAVEARATDTLTLQPAG
jgi:penicillin amidase